MELKNLEAERKKKPNDHASLTLQIIRVNEELMEQHPPKSNKRECIRKKIRRVGFVTNKFQDEGVEWYKNRKTPEQNKKALVRRPNNRPPVSRMEVLLANNNDANAQILAKIIPDIEALKIGAAAAAPSTDVNAQMATNAAPSPSTDVASPATTTVSAAATSSTATIMKSDSCDIADDDDDELTAQPPTDVDAQMATKLAKALADIEALIIQVGAAAPSSSTDVNAQMTMASNSTRSSNSTERPQLGNTPQQQHIYAYWNSVFSLPPAQVGVANTVSAAAASSTGDIHSSTTTVSAAAAASSTATIMKSDSCGIADDDDELTAQPPTDVDAQMATKLAKALADIEAWSKIIS